MDTYLLCRHNRLFDCGHGYRGKNGRRPLLGFIGQIISDHLIADLLARGNPEGRRRNARSRESQSTSLVTFNAKREKKKKKGVDIRDGCDTREERGITLLGAGYNDALFR